MSIGRLHLHWETASPLEDIMSIGRLHLHWETASPLEDIMSIGRLHLHWETASPLEDSMSIGRLHLHWKISSPLGDCISIGRLHLHSNQYQWTVHSNTRSEISGNYYPAFILICDISYANKKTLKKVTKNLFLSALIKYS